MGAIIGHHHDYSWPEYILTVWATLILGILALTSLILRNLANPLSCFLPTQFEKSHVDYVYQRCFHSHAIILPEQAGGVNLDPVSRNTYHQWLPFFLGITALLCLLPHLTSRLLTPLLWLDLGQLMTSLTPHPHHSTDNRHAIFRQCALLLHAGFRKGNSVLAKAALGRKVLGCGVCLLQMLLMIVVFPPQLSLQGEKAEEGHAADDNGSLPLPLSTFICPITIRQHERIFQYNVQCFMPLARVYSKGLLFLVLFFLVLFLLSAMDLTLISMRLLLSPLKDLTLTRFLSLNNGQSQSQAAVTGPAHLSTFSQSGGQVVVGDGSTQPFSQSEGQVVVDSSAQQSGFLQSLGMDGRWVVWVVGERCGTLAAADLSIQLYQVFKESPPPIRVPVAESGFPMTEETEEDTGAVPMVTISLKDGDNATENGEKEKI
ncbi:hypothetical protein ACOMHN_001275 [Nucella lapillus]